MKCDELIAEKLSGECFGCEGGIYEVYDKAEVDAAIAELKREHHIERHEYIDMVAQRESDIRKLKRSLWIARSKRAIEKIAWFKLWNASISTMNPEDGARQEYDKWKNALGKFLAKAKEYK